jgi:hypothetical protein
MGTSGRPAHAARSPAVSPVHNIHAQGSLGSLAGWQGKRTTRTDVLSVEMLAVEAEKTATGVLKEQSVLSDKKLSMEPWALMADVYGDRGGTARGPTALDGSPPRLVETRSVVCAGGPRATAEGAPVPHGAPASPAASPSSSPQRPAPDVATLPCGIGAPKKAGQTTHNGRGSAAAPAGQGAAHPRGPGAGHAEAWAAAVAVGGRGSGRAAGGPAGFAAAVRLGRALRQRDGGAGVHGGRGEGARGAAILD